MRVAECFFRRCEAFRMKEKMSPRCSDEADSLPLHRVAGPGDETAEEAALRKGRLVPA